jgi:ACT domain-containing protein
MHEKSPELSEQHIDQIKLLMLDHTDGEIIKTLGIGKTTYYKLKKVIIEESTENFKNQRWEEFSTYLENYDTLLAECIMVLREKMKQTESAKDAVLCAAEIKDIATARINLKSDGLKALKKDNPGIVQRREEVKELPDDYNPSDPGISTDDNPIV